MASYIGRRLLQMIPLVLLITFIAFGIMQLAPGNPMQRMINPNFSPEQIAKAERALGLDRPIPHQYWGWLRSVATGNLGYSISTGQAVIDLLVQRLPATLLLAGTALALSFLIGIPLGILSAVRKYTALDYVLTLFSFLGTSVPAFFLGLGLIYLVALRWGWLPTSGMSSVGQALQGWPAVSDVARHLVLPALTMAAQNTALVLRHVRSSVLEALGQDFIRTARAKGLSGIKVVYRHALPNALLPVITLVGLSLPSVVGGSFVIETVFAWPGLGQLGYQATSARDYPVLMALNLLTALAVVSGNLLADILYAAVDPRIRYN